MSQSRWLRVTVLAAAALLTASGGPIVGNGAFPANRTFPPVSTWKFDWKLFKTLPGDLVPPVKVAQTRLEYANMCATEVGNIPEFNCLLGDPIPIKVNGEEKFTVIPGTNCDRPSKLYMGDSNCVPGSRLLDLSPTGPNITNVKTFTAVTIVAICRKYNKPMAADHFADIAVIAHNRNTGTTCFFQSPVDSAPAEGWDGNQVPSPMSDSAAAEKLWLGPKKGLDGVMYTNPGGNNGAACVNCHDADPFILSPYVQQVVSESLLNRWDPNGRHNVDKFGWLTPVSSRRWVVRAKEGVDATAACTGCHRIGGGSFDAISSGEDFNGKTNFHGYMPTFALKLEPEPWQTTYGPTITALQQCLYPPGGAAPAADCNAVRAGRLVN